jgi:hypothetical protein
VVRILALIPVAFAAGCLPLPRPAGPRPEPTDPNHPEVTVRIDPQQVTFTDPAMQTAFRELDAAARRLAGPDWVVRNPGTYASRDPEDRWRLAPSYAAWWSLRPVPDGAYDPNPRPKHQVKIEVNVRPDGVADSFSVVADREPEAGWGAWVTYARYPDAAGPLGGLGFTVFHPEHRPRPHPGSDRMRFGGGGLEVSVFRPDDRFNYALTASSDPPADPAGRRPPVHALRAYWRSAESFRDAALADLDRLDANLRDPARRWLRTTAKHPRRAADAKEAERTRPPDPIRAALLEEALAEVEGRRRLVREHFKDMHAAAVAAFPELADILDPPPAK